MSDTTLRILLPIYCLAFGAVCFLWRTLRFRRAYGKNPIITGRIDTPHGFLGAIASLLSPAIGFVTLLFAASPERYVAWMRPFSWYGSTAARWFGAATLAGALALAAVAQAQMGPSWRVGIDTTERTAIVRHGLYRHSRNPIYLGLILIGIGYLLILPDPFTLVICVQGWTVFQLLVRLEEQHMRSLHGVEFEAYCRQTPRWLFW
ncbi:MAG TPA: isoprenylcysteine carboxylmethyltransferase family protein [Polyangiaceae bacterium]|nr:isoprenylcysteine carboxylmethyltransferase family protein [Polyangiaceae bacterium]